MKFLALLAALLIEQVHPLRRGNRIERLFALYARRIERRFNGGGYRHGVMAWLLAVAPAVVVAQGVNLALLQVSLLLAWLWNVAVLYLVVGFRQFSHHFTQIAEALREERLDAAREELGRWRGEPAAGLTAGETARLAIEWALLACHRHVFGTIAWFLVAGAPGAILYRLAGVLDEQWDAGSEPRTEEFGRFARRCFFWLDWIPARLTAASFAIAGNFEDAVYRWRTQASSWATEAHVIILAAGGGALGARLGGHVSEAEGAQYDPGPDIDAAADVDDMRSAVGLVWRALVLWMTLILVVTVAHALG